MSYKLISSIFRVEDSTILKMGAGRYPEMLVPSLKLHRYHSLEYHHLNITVRISNLRGSIIWLQHGTMYGLVGLLKLKNID
jgi:hypothetical protein